MMTTLFGRRQVFGTPLLGLRASRRRTTVKTDFRLDDYGADPTGNSLSDAAWKAALADAQAAVAMAGKARITGSPGRYTFSLGVVVIPDARIGFECDGATDIYGVGSAGDLITARGASPAGTKAATIGGFALKGSRAGAGANGLRYGGRIYGGLYDIGADGFSGRGVWVGKDGMVEGTDARGLSSRLNGVNFCFDGGPPHNNSFDYSSWDLHVVAGNLAMQVVHGAHCYGGDIRLHGNVTKTLLQVGADDADTAWLHCGLHIGAEADGGPVTDFLIHGVDINAGLHNCFGGIELVAASGTWRAGAITGGARMSFLGMIDGSPLVAASPGFKTPLGRQFSAFDSAHIW